MSGVEYSIILSETQFLENVPFDQNPVLFDNGDDAKIENCPDEYFDAQIVLGQLKLYSQFVTEMELEPIDHEQQDFDSEEEIGLELEPIPGYDEFEVDKSSNNFDFEIEQGLNSWWNDFGNRFVPSVPLPGNLDVIAEENASVEDEPSDDADLEGNEFNPQTLPISNENTKPLLRKALTEPENEEDAHGDLNKENFPPKIKYEKEDAEDKEAKSL